MKERSSKDRPNEDKRREGSPERREKKWEGPPSENVERRRGPGRGVEEPEKRTPQGERK